MIDSKGKLFGKISIIDLGFLLVLILAISVMVYRMTTERPVADVSSEIVLQFYSDEAPDFAAAAIKEKDLVTDFENGSIFGRVSAVKVGPANSVAQTDAGELIRASRPGFSAINLTVKAEGVHDAEGGLLLNNLTYFIGKQVVLRSGDAVYMARLSGITDEAQSNQTQKVGEE
jgi:Domain of unknown function (DUF4330)